MLQIIPERLLGLPNCHTLLSDGRSLVMHKTLDESLPNIGKFVAVPLLLYLRQGEQHVLHADGGEHRLGPHELLFLPRDVYVVSDFVPVGNQPLDALLFFIDDRLMSHFLQGRQLPVGAAQPATEATVAGTQGAHILSSSPAVRAFMDALLLVYGSGCADPALLEVKVLELLHLLAHQPDGRAWLDAVAAALQRPRPAIADVMRQYAAHPLSVREYAALARRSVSTFTRDFRRLHGVTPLQWLTLRRLETAQDALRLGSSVTEAGLAAGYSNVSHFIRAYKRQFGDTPRRSLQERRVQ